MTVTVDATGFADLETATVEALQPITDVTVSNMTPSPIPAKLVTVAYAGGGNRDWGEASGNVGVNVFAQTDAACRALVKLVQDKLAVTSNDQIEGVQVPAGGGTVVPAQKPPFQRYFVATVTLRGQSVL